MDSKDFACLKPLEGSGTGPSRCLSSLSWPQETFACFSVVRPMCHPSRGDWFCPLKAGAFGATAQWLVCIGFLHRSHGQSFPGHTVLVTLCTQDGGWRPCSLQSCFRWWSSGWTFFSVTVTPGFCAKAQVQLMNGETQWSLCLGKRICEKAFLSPLWPLVCFKMKSFK